MSIIIKVYCAGVFLIKNDSIGKEFLKDCINTYIETSHCKVNNKYSLNSAWTGEMSYNLNKFLII